MSDPHLLPRPRHYQARAGRLKLRNGLPIVLPPTATDADFASAVALRDTLLRTLDLHLPIETHARADGLGPAIELQRSGARGDAYRIEIAPGGARLSGEGPAGLRYAVETTLQLVSGGALPACSIDDAPDFPKRGIMLDVSRGKVPTLETLCALVDLCVRTKLNVLMLYVEHTFAFRRHPKIGADSSPLDAETLRALDTYAAAHHVELVPNLQSLGHMERLLSLREYAPLAETDARWTLACAEPGTYQLLADLYDEFLPNFRSPLFCADCDEPWDLGRGKSKTLAEALGPGGLLLDHVRKLDELTRAHRKQLMIWADFVHSHPERIPEFTKDVVFLDWWYEAEHDFDKVRRFAEHGLPFWVCPGTSSWNCLFPRMENALTNVSRWADAGRRHGAGGLLVTDWGDFGHYNLQGNSWLAYAWAAQQSWSGDEAPARFDRAFTRLLFGDGSGEAARLYRELGAVHDAGFRIFNGSALQFLFFDDVDLAYFVRGAKPAVAKKSLARLERIRRKLVADARRFGVDALTHAELVYAADASIYALRKALAGLEYVAWREQPGRLGAAARRKLARTFTELADEARALAERLAELWLARSHVSEIEKTARRIDRAVASLRRAARALAANRPPKPPPAHEGFAPGVVIRILRDSVKPA
jgi:hexosaminidase